MGWFDENAPPDTLRSIGELRPMPSHEPKPPNDLTLLDWLSDKLSTNSGPSYRPHQHPVVPRLSPTQNARLNQTLDSLGARSLEDLGAGLMTMGTVSEGMPGIRAFHGSPHDFDKFSLSKIGTGEGAQAYGHGLYFAENEGVAKAYRDGLSGTTYNPEWMTLHQEELKLIDTMNRISDQVQAESVARGAKGAPGWGDIGAVHPEVEAKWAPVYAQAEKQLSEARQKMSPLPQTVHNPGKMYEVGIKADPDTLLDWDKPLSQQPAKVRDVMEKAPIPMRDRWKESGAWEHVKGETLYRELAGNKQGPVQIAYTLRSQSRDSIANRIRSIYPKMTDVEIQAAIDQGMSTDAAAATQALRQSGVTGIRYKDAGSRSAEGGTHNYVIFDDAIIDILKKYGLAGVMAGGAGAKAWRERGQER